MHEAPRYRYRYIDIVCTCGIFLRNGMYVYVRKRSKSGTSTTRRLSIGRIEQVPPWQSNASTHKSHLIALFLQVDKVLV